MTKETHETRQPQALVNRHFSFRDGYAKWYVGEMPESSEGPIPFGLQGHVSLVIPDGSVLLMGYNLRDPNHLLYLDFHDSLNEEEGVLTIPIANKPQGHPLDILKSPRQACESTEQGRCGGPAAWLVEQLFGDEALDVVTFLNPRGQSGEFGEDHVESIPLKPKNVRLRYLLGCIAILGEAHEDLWDPPSMDAEDNIFTPELNALICENWEKRMEIYGNVSRLTKQNVEGLLKANADELHNEHLPILTLNTLNYSNLNIEI